MRETLSEGVRLGLKIATAIVVAALLSAPALWLVHDYQQTKLKAERGEAAWVYLNEQVAKAKK